MKPFYLTKNAQGYYRAVFFNQQTGVCVKTKSTHTKDKMEAMLLAAEWYKNGTPDGYTNSRKKADDDVSVSGLNFDGIVKRLSQAEAVLLVSLISQKFNLNTNISVATADPTPQVAAPAVVVTPTPSVEAPKKKVVVVHKKNALSDSGMIPADVAAKVYEPLNPECTMKLCEFLMNFWTPEKSEYIQNKRAHKKTIGDYHCKEMRGMVNRYWLPFFGEEFTVGELTEQYLEDFLQELANFRCLKGATINHARTCGATGLKWLKNKGIIHSNPMANVEAFSKSDATPRGIPTEEDKRMIHYFNKACFLISDKKYILCVTEVLFETLGMYFKMKIVMFLTRTKQLFRPDLLITMGNVNNDIYLCRGVLNVAKALNADVFELEKYFA